VLTKINEICHDSKISNGLQGLSECGNFHQRFLFTILDKHDNMDKAGQQ
jgi:hypothetical protein